MAKPVRRTTSSDFFRRLVWIDGRPLLDTIEPYRRAIFTKALDTFRRDGVPVYNLVLSGRAKKNYKSTDLILAGLFCLLIRQSPQGNDALILANDEGQAGDDLALAKKLVAVNPDLASEVTVLAKAIVRKDGFGSMRILPAKDATGAHGKTSIITAFDEIHGYRNWDLLEALQPDPTRTDALTWITSYDAIASSPGIPLFDLKTIGKAGTDPRMLFSWYSGDYCTDPDFADLEPELRANPSIGAWPEGRDYIEQQRRRLPTHKFRRLHLNLPGGPAGAYLDQGKVLAAIVTGRTAEPYQEGRSYYGFVDMSGGSNDDAVLGIGHLDGCTANLDRIEKQAGGVPFNPNMAVVKFVGLLRDYHLSSVMGDRYAGNTFAAMFQSMGVAYQVCPWSASELYEAFEPALNAGEVELLDHTTLQEQLICLVLRGSKVDHQPGDHDDFANAAAGVVYRARQSLAPADGAVICAPAIVSGQPHAVPGGVLDVGEVAAPVIAAALPARADPSSAPQRHLSMQNSGIPAGYLASNQRAREPWRAYVNGAGGGDRWSPRRGGW